MKKFQQKQPNKYWKMQSLGNNEADIHLFGEVVSSGYEWSDSDTSATTFKQELDALGSVNNINLHINSPGGSVFEGVAIGNMLKQHPAKVNVYIDGLAASIASVIAMCADTIFMPSNAMMMVHNPWSWAVGNAADMRKQADTLDAIGESMKLTYLEKAGDKLDAATLTSLLDNETWLSAQDCINYGLADEILPANQTAASISQDLFARYRNVPKAFQKPKEEPKEPSLLQQKFKIIRGVN
jgi:ATP-dependent Clp protease protease subunit